MRAFNAHLDSPRKYAEVDHLFLKLQGISPSAISESEALARDIVTKHGGKDWMFAEGEEAESIWTDRKHAAFAGVLYGGPGSKSIPTDVWSAPFSFVSRSPLIKTRRSSVPVSKLPQLVEDV